MTPDETGRAERPSVGDILGPVSELPREHPPRRSTVVDAAAALRAALSRLADEFDAEAELLESEPTRARSAGEVRWCARKVRALSEPSR